jgi:hypothetical protein
MFMEDGLIQETGNGGDGGFPVGRAALTADELSA